MEYVIDLYRDKRDRKVLSSKFTYEKILKICFRYGRYHLGAAFLEEMKKENVPRDQMFYNLILKDVAKLKDISAIDYIRRFIEKDEISLNVKMYSSILQAYYHLRDERSFSRTLQEMLAKGISADVYIFVQIISFYGKLSRRRDMVNWFEKLKGTIEPNVEVYNALIDGLLYCSDYEASIKYLEEMKKAGIEPNVRTYNTLIGGFSGDKEKMLSIIDEMNKKQMSFDKHTFMLVVTYLADHEQFGQAEQFIDKMESHQIFSADPYNSLLFRLGKSGNYQVRLFISFLNCKEMERIVARMKSKGIILNEDTYNSLISVYSHRDVPQKLKEVLEEMEREGIPPSRRSIDIIKKKRPKVLHLLFGPLFIVLLIPPCVYTISNYLLLFISTHKWVGIITT